MAAKLNTAYLSSHRGIIKILQIVFGLIVCTLLCIGSYGFFSGCFYDGKIGAASGINAVIVILNIVFFVLNLMDTHNNKWERIYTLVALILFVVAFALMLWNLLETHSYYGQTKIPATVFIGIQMALFIWDYRILHGQA